MFNINICMKILKSVNVIIQLFTVTAMINSQYKSTKHEIVTEMLI